MGDSNKENKPGFFKTVAAEFKKIVWPSRESVFKQSVAVTCVCLVLGVLITIFDFLIQYGINFITQ
jgi:preprotein translocase subunit SecE